MLVFFLLGLLSLVMMFGCLIPARGTEQKIQVPPWSKYMARSPKGRLRHGLYKPIHGICAIYFCPVHVSFLGCICWFLWSFHRLTETRQRSKRRVPKLSRLKGTMKWTWSIKKAPEFQRHQLYSIVFELGKCRSVYPYD